MANMPVLGSSRSSGGKVASSRKASGVFPVPFKELSSNMRMQVDSCGSIVRPRRANVFSFFPHAQKDIGLREAAHGVGISRVELDRFLQFVQSEIPFALPAMHKSDKRERQRSC